MQLHPKLKPVLENIDFLSRYRALHEKFPLIDGVMHACSNEEVLRVLESLGYKFKYAKKENFFGLKEVISNYAFTFNISCKYGVVELIWDIVLNGERLMLGGPWGLTCDLLLNDTCDIKKPAFKSCDELKDILQEALSIYEDFKKEAMKEFA